MTHQLDASFRQRKQSFAAWRRRARMRRFYAALGVALSLMLATAAYFAWDYWMNRDLDEEIAMTDDMVDLPDDAAVYVPAIVDLAGDPIWITLSQDASGSPRTVLVDRPEQLSGSGVSPKIELLSDEMLSSSEEFITTIPSSQEDFAFFQSQRGTAAPAPAPADDTDIDLQPTDEPTDAAPAPAAGDEHNAGWDDLGGAPDAALPGFEKTAIENNTTVATTTPESDRFESTRDRFVRVLAARSLESVALEAGFGRDDARLADAALKSVFGREGLEAGFVVAMRGFRMRRGGPEALMQLSVYARDTFIGTLVRGDDGQYASGADPWVSKDLFNYSGMPDRGGEKRQYRLLDAIYSTAARNNVPSGVIGEAIMYLSRGNDLNLFAAEGDRLVMAYSQEARSRSAGGRVLYVAIRGPDRNIECYVFAQPNGDFVCVSGDDRVQSAAVASGMTVPVDGVLTSTFGPRKHPILNVVRLHKGVDWKAPVGSPVVAAYDGEIVFEGDGGGYGNLVRIAHEGGRETRYAHMQRFAIENAVGTRVKAGTVIGYVGTTGLSTGPHLHFEMYQGGQAVDPLGTVTVAVAAVSEPLVATTTAAEDEAVEILTNKIIHVESGGSARAKNPLSSATGLGQFISKTWIRMMNTYRPDLARTMTTAELLELRFDPTLSREMVRNLAREGEAYLKQRGHGITAGRLYLCHFLGMEGAHLVLSAARTEALVNVVGAGVIQANPFLAGKEAGYVVDWAERKMRGARGLASAPSSQAPSAPVAAMVEVRQDSPEFQSYKQAMSAIIAMAQPIGQP
ncbi:MAG: M23 family metallopeptidase [Rhizobiaceae bacterium]|nr:M23 family metallopeptidase [Rhizobiaceae bacterium]